MPLTNPNILITGACGVTSRSIVRSLRMSKIFADYRYIGIDICDNEFGIYEGLYAKIHQVPLAAHDEYENIVRTICARESIVAAIVVPEPEVLVWSGLQFGIPSLLPPQSIAEILISKQRQFEILSPLGFAPKYHMVSMETSLNDPNTLDFDIDYPVWIRDASDGTTSGKGSFRATSDAEVQEWMAFLSKTTDAKHIMISEYLSGKGYACTLVFHNNKLFLAACCERITYFMSHLTASGVTGNTSKGRIFYDQQLVDFCEEVLKSIAKHAHEQLHGTYTVDIKESDAGNMYITEINMRHNAFTSSFAAAGANLAETQLLATLGRFDEIPAFNSSTIQEGFFLRDIDGLPAFIKKESFSA